MKKVFDRVRMLKPKKSVFDLTHDVKLTGNMGTLIPFYIQEIVPGDKFKVQSELLIKMAPMISPVMHRINVYTHYFFVPMRLVWSKWEDFITGGDQGDLQPVHPYITYSEINREHFLSHLVPDYMGVNISDYKGVIDTQQEVKINSLPFRAYQRVFNDYYRDENLRQEIPLNLDGEGEETNPTELVKLRKRPWQKDYFTSALPNAQKGGTVEMPVTGGALFSPQYKPASEVHDTTGGIVVDGALENLSGFVSVNDGTEDHQAQIDNLETDQTITLDGVSFDINEFRRANRLQRWLERNARGGTRYNEQILSHFGVRTKDSRLNRSEYLGGGMQNVVIGENQSTAQITYDDEGETITIPQANRAGVANSYGTSHGFSRYFSEHGYVIGIMSVLPRTAYFQGVPRMFIKQDKFSYYWPEFAQLGEQEVYNGELYLEDIAPDGTDVLRNDGVFGYQSRYVEYKQTHDKVCGAFQTAFKHWHMGRYFENQPKLNDLFVYADPTTRIFAVEDEIQMFVNIVNHVKAIRPMPVFGTPTL